MKQLILIRHAKSSWGNADLDDFERPLNQQGEHQASFMGKRLCNRAVQPDLILSSPTKRAFQTALIIAKAIGYPTQEIITPISLYTFEADELLEEICTIEDQYQHVMLFGHNPGITRVVSYLTGKKIDTIPPCGIFCINFSTSVWKAVTETVGSLVFYDYPDYQI